MSVRQTSPNTARTEACQFTCQFALHSIRLLRLRLSVRLREALSQATLHPERPQLRPCDLHKAPSSADSTRTALLCIIHHPNSPDKDNAEHLHPRTRQRLGGIMQAATQRNAGVEPSHPSAVGTPDPSCTRYAQLFHHAQSMQESSAPLYTRAIRDACASKRLKQRGIDRS